MKKTLLIFFALLTVYLFFSGCANTEDNVTETKMFDIRTGVNVSHWLSQSQKRGEERKNYIVKADFDTIKAMGFDHVRIPVDEIQLWNDDGGQEPEAFELLHNAIGWAFDTDLKVIVDLHIIRSHYFNAEIKPLWTDPAEQEKLVNLWKQLSAELIQYPVNKLAYEILNEAVADDPEDWNKLAAKVIADIRIREPQRVIVLGSNRWQHAKTFPDLKVPANDKNILLSFHFYRPMGLTHHQTPWTKLKEYSGPVNYPGWIIDTTAYEGLSDELVKYLRDGANGNFDQAALEKLMMPAIVVAKEFNLPLYCGEYGIYPKIPEEVALRWYKDVTQLFNKHNISYTHWGYKGDFPVVGENSTPNEKLASVLTAK